MARKPAAPAPEAKPAPKPTARLTVSGDSPLSARPAGPAPAVWGRCGACKLVHAPGACRLTAAAPGLLKGPSASATIKAPQGPAFVRERDAHCLPPQAPGLELPDDVLSLAQAAAGDGDLVEWISQCIRNAVTPKASTVTPQTERNVTQAAPRNANAERQAAYRARKRSGKVADAIAAVEAAGSPARPLVDRARRKRKDAKEAGDA